ncbi:MAG: DUF599 domain-containing protein [Pseudomonadota bacterium]
MNPLQDFAALSVLDGVAVFCLWAAWFGIGWWIEHPGSKRPSVTVLMVAYRHDWMREMVTRDPRIFDAQILGNLRQGTAFYASTSVLALGGVLALIGNSEVLLNVAEDISLASHPELIWRAKLMVVALFLLNSFLKFVWANRLFGYCAVVMASVPNDVAHPRAYPRATKAAALNVRAAWNFNRGLRSVYFALGSLAWLLGPIALLMATAVTLWTVWEREFASKPRDIILGEEPEDP